jgi:hypothetical protein
MKKLFVFILILLFCGCSINKETITKAEEVCEQNTGMSHINITNFRKITVVCNNGAIFHISYFNTTH